MKAGMYLAGMIDSPVVRPPTEAPNEKEMQALRAALDKAGLLQR
jgi:4-hydroxy-tetrahydrodipicolinate synthase